jgi:leucyl aminopeptidase
MNFEHVKTTLSQTKGDIVVVGLFKGEDAGKVLKTLDGKLPSALQEAAKHHLDNEGFKGKASEIVSVPTFGHITASRMLVVGLGAKDEYNSTVVRKVAGAVARKVKTNGSSAKVVLYLREKDSAPTEKTKASKAKKAPAPAVATAGGAGAATEHVSAAVEGWVLGSFDFDKYKSQKDKKEPATGAAKTKAAAAKKPVITLSLGGVNLEQKAFQKAVREAESLAEATTFARALITEPPVYMTPTRLSLEAKEIARESNLTCTVLNTQQMEKLGMGLFLGVARGADEPPKFIILKYTAPKSKKTVGIIGKGITFDSGGLSLKTAQGMERMKYDMSGAACVLGVMKVVGALKPNVSVVAVVAATENMPGGNALHPGDVITAMNGKTVEVNNTDAEGRLVLADALTYAIKEKADELIDVATLTGAVVTALGRVAAGIMGTNQNLINQLIIAGEKSGEKYWQLPLYDEYKTALQSDIADLINAGSRGEAGSSCGGMFLKEFVDGKPWAHLDIAGVAWSEKNANELSKGGVGFGVRTLSNYILSQ